MLTYAFPDRTNYTNKQRWLVGESFPFAESPESVTLTVSGAEAELVLNAIRAASTKDVLLYVPDDAISGVSSGVYNATVCPTGKLRFHPKKTQLIHTVLPHEYIKHDNGTYSVQRWEHF